MLVAGLDGQFGPYLELRAHAAAEAVLRFPGSHLVGECDEREVLLLDAEVVDVVFQEEGIVEPSAYERLVVGQPHDVLGQHVVGGLEVGLDVVPPVVARAVQRIAQVQQVLVGEAVVQVAAHDGQRAFKVTARQCATVDLVARADDIVAVPVVLAARRVGGDAVVPRVRQRQADTEVVHEEAALLIAGPHAPRPRLAFGLSDDARLHLPRLQLLVDVLVGGADEELVGPRFVGDSDLHLGQHAQVVVVETAAVLRQELAHLLVPHLDILHHVVVLRVVHTDGGPYGQPVLQHILPVEVGLVGVEGAEAIGDVEEISLLALRHDIDGTAQGIAAEPRGHHALVYLYVVNHADGHVGNGQSRTLCVEGNAVEEVAHRRARHAVDAQFEVGTHAAVLANLHAGRAVDDAVDGVQRANHGLHVDGIHRQRTLAQPLSLRLGRDGDGIKPERVANFARPLASLLTIGHTRSQQEQ